MQALKSMQKSKSRDSYFLCISVLIDSLMRITDNDKGISVFLSIEVKHKCSFKKYELSRCIGYLLFILPRKQETGWLWFTYIRYQILLT